MNEHDRFLVIGAAFIVSLLIGMAVGALWSTFMAKVNVSALFLG